MAIHMTQQARVGAKKLAKAYLAYELAKATYTPDEGGAANLYHYTHALKRLQDYMGVYVVAPELLQRSLRLADEHLPKQVNAAAA